MGKEGQFGEDFWVKLVSLALAVMIWSAVAARGPADDRNGAGLFSTVINRESKTLTAVPITVLTAAEDSRGYLVTPAVVNVTISGETDAVRGVLIDEVEAYVNLTDLVDASGLRKQIRVRIPGGIRLEKMDPPTVEVTINAAGSNRSSGQANP